MKDLTPHKVEISYKTILFTVFTFIALWLLIQIKDIIILIFLSIILLSALSRPVEWLSAKKIPRVFALIIVYIVILLLIAAAISLIIPPLVSQTTDFVSRLPQIISSVNRFLDVYKIPVQQLANPIQQISSHIFSISTAVFSSFVLIITLFVLTFYLILGWKNIVQLIASPFSGLQEKKVIELITKIEIGLGNWVRGQLTLSVIVATVIYLGLILLRVPYALPLAIIAGALEVIPIVGPIIASIPAMLVGFASSQVLGISTIALFFIVQQLENHLIVPMVMSKVVGLPPPIVIIALLIGARLNGVGGAFLAVPILVVAKILFEELLVGRSLQNQEADE